MKLSAPDLSAETRSAIERAIKAPADWPIELQGLVTTDLPDAPSYPYALLFDTTLGQPKFSDGTSWLTFSLSNHTHTSFGALTISGAINLTGGQIGFPATQVPSADANTLDDYEEGTFTPALTFGGGSTGITYSKQHGRYTKIGRLVFAEVNIILTSKGSSVGQAQISMPFACAGSPEHGGCIISANNMTSVVVPFATMDASSSLAGIRDIAGSSLANLSEANFQNTTTLRISLTYTV